MKKVISLLIILQFLILIITPSAPGLSRNNEIMCYSITDTVCNSIIYVDDDGGADYIHIQDAIDNATAGDTIIVYNGTYNENIVVYKKLYIMGCGKSNIVGIGDSEDTPVVLINVDEVNLHNFIIQGFFDGLFLSAVNDCQITNNHIINNYRGIYLIESYDIVISNNLISNNTKYGIMFQRCAHDLIMRNEFVSNEGIAIFIYDAANNEVKYNNFWNNQIDAFVMNSPINYWEGNYWNKARLFPKIIFCLRSIIPWVNFDWHPAMEPNEI